MPPPWPLVVTPLTPASCGAVLWRRAGALGVTILVKATFRLIHDEPARLMAPLEMVREDRLHSPAGSLAEASETAPYLPTAGVVLSGHAYAPGGYPTAAMSVRLAIFRERRLLDKTLHVYGDRTPTATTSQPFVKLPLLYERAYGGPDVPGNPVGCGAELHSPQRPGIVDAIDAHRPAGFGPIAKHWPARQRLLGATDVKALEQPVAEIPESFDWTYFQAAPPDQRIEALHGDEWIVLDGLHPNLPRLQTRLPSARAQARWHLVTASGTSPGRPIDLRADTLVIDADRQLCSLLWRGSFVLERPDLLPWVRVFAGVEPPDQPLSFPAPEAITPSPPAVQRPAPPAPQVVQRAPQTLTGTLEHDMHAVVSSTLPFSPVNPAKAGPSPGSPPLPTVNRAPSAFTGTADHALHGILLTILPFGPQASASASASAPAPKPPPAEPVMSAPATSGVRAMVIGRLRACEPLHDLNLAGADLHDLDFSETSLVRCNLKGANLARCIFTNTRLAEAQLASADLTEAILTGADLARADLSRAVITRARLDGCTLTEANMERLSGDSADLSRIRLEGADLRQARLRDARFDGAILRGITATKADLTRSSFVRADLSGAILRSGKLKEANLSHADLTGADFREADLERANVHGANRKTAKMAGANIKDLIETEPEVE